MVAIGGASILAMGQTAAHPAAAEDFFVGEWLVQPSLGVLSRRPISTHLEPKTMQVLLCLATRPGTVVSKDQLLRSVWPDTFVSEHVLTQAVWQLRQAFGANDVIQTIPRRGYRLIAAVRPVPAERIRCLAVLPLANLSGNSDQEYFADGMTEALISALAQIGRLRVISRTSAMRYKGTSKSLPEIAAELHVDDVVEGSVIRAGDRVRVSVQLINAATDQHIWAKNYDRNLRDVLDLQDEVARTIASEIQVTLTPDEDKRLARSRPVNPVAHELYLKGRYCSQRLTQESGRAAADYMRQAIAVDPEYALAYAGLAGCAAMLSAGAVKVAPPIAQIETIRPALLRALELDPTLSEAHQWLGWTRLICEWNWAGAEEALTRAINLNPSSGDAYGLLGWLYLALKRNDEAVVARQQACQMDPLNVYHRASLAYVLALAGNLDQAMGHLHDAIRLEPNHHFPHEVLSGALWLMGRHDEAIAAAETAVQLCRDPVPMTYLGHMYAAGGRTSEARAILQEFQELAKTRYVGNLCFASILLGLGELKSTLDYLEQAQKMREVDLLFIRNFPLWQPLHGHPRFQEVVRRMNFPE